MCLHRPFKTRVFTLFFSVLFTRGRLLCSNLVREDVLFKHQLICQTNVQEHECNRFSGVQLNNDYASRSSVSGCLRKYKLNVEPDKDYEDILTYTCRQAKLRILDVL